MTLAYLGAEWVNVIPQVLARGMQNSQNQMAISQCYDAGFEGEEGSKSPGVQEAS